MCVAELPIFYYGEEIINKFGILNMFTIAHFAYGVRVYGYSIIPQTYKDSWYILCLEPLHAITYAQMWLAAVEHSSQLISIEYQGTMQGIIFGIYGGLADAIGCVLGGYLFLHYGGAWMFRNTGYVILAWMVIFQVLFRCTKPKQLIDKQNTSK